MIFEFGKFGFVGEYLEEWYYTYRGTSRWSPWHSGFARRIHALGVKLRTMPV